MAVELGVQLERDCALEDAKDFIDERGDEIKLNDNEEAVIVRDEYGSIINRTPTQYTMNAFPVEFQPTDDQLEKAGIREAVDVIIYLATLDFTNNSIDYRGIDTTRWEVILKGDLYTIKEKNEVNMFANTYLNVALGLFKK